MASCPSIDFERSSALQWVEGAFKAVCGRVNHLLCNVWALMICKLIIGTVSAFDTYLTMKYVISLETYEQNPIGRWLMGLDSGPVCETQQIAAFITAKFVGTLLVLLAIQAVAYYRVRLATMIAIPVTGFQIYLASHLLFGIA